MYMTESNHVVPKTECATVSGLLTMYKWVLWHSHVG